jgi:hypothetical protein
MNMSAIVSPWKRSAALLSSASVHGAAFFRSRFLWCYECSTSVIDGCIWCYAFFSDSALEAST